MASVVDLVPKRDEVVAARTGLIASVWLRWLAALRDAVNAAPQLEAASVRLPGQSGSMLATAFNLAPLKAGLYRVSVFLRETSGSGAVVSVGYTFDGVTSTVDVPSCGSVLVQVDADSALTYGITASGVSYDAALVVERVEAA